MPRHPAGLVPRRIAPGYTADRSVNFGDVVTIAGNEIKQLCRVSLEHASMMTLVVSCDAIEVPAQLMTAFSYRPMVRVSWGNGNMSLQADYDVTVRRSVPLPASYIDVQVWICPLPYPGANVPIGPPLLDGPSVITGKVSRSALSVGLLTAASAQRKGETALYTLLALGDSRDAEPAEFARLVASLKAAGLPNDARALAVELALAYGI